MTENDGGQVDGGGPPTSFCLYYRLIAIRFVSLHVYLSLPSCALALGDVMVLVRALVFIFCFNC